MSNALIIIGHPYWKDSVANRAILEELQKLRPQIKLSNLIELYPDFDIDIEAEQRKLIEADTVIWQFPLMWYSCPSIMRRYLEGVLSYGFAYGSSGSKLENKRLIASITTGVKQSVYEGGILGFSAEDLFKPLAQVVKMCSMLWEPPQVTFGLNSAGAKGDEIKLEEIRIRCREHARLLSERL